MIKALNNNIKNSNIEEIILLNEEKLDLDYPKVKQIVINKRLTYKFAFDWAKTNLPTGKNVILCNSDIWFDNSICNIKHFNMTNTIMALSRYDIQKNGKYKLFDKYQRSQDSWIFENPIKLDHNYDIELGRGGCDNRIAWIIKNSTKNNKLYKVINPVLLIKSYHEHLHNIRKWKADEIRGPYSDIDIYPWVLKKNPTNNTVYLKHVKITPNHFQNIML